MSKLIIKKNDNRITLLDEEDIQDKLDEKVDNSDLSTIATSGSYTDLSDKPTIPTKTSDLTNDSNFLTSHQDISGKVDRNELSNVATTGSYNDLSNKPTIPSNTSDLTNDSGFLTDNNITIITDEEDAVDDGIYIYGENNEYTLTLSTTDDSIQIGDDTTISALLKKGNTPIIGETIIFKVGNNTYSSITNNNGIATHTFTANTNGEFTFQVNYLNLLTDEITINVMRLIDIHFNFQDLGSNFSNDVIVRLNQDLNSEIEMSPTIVNNIRTYEGTFENIPYDPSDDTFNISVENDSDGYLLYIDDFEIDANDIINNVYEYERSSQLFTIIDEGFDNWYDEDWHGWYDDTDYDLDRSWSTYPFDSNHPLLVHDSVSTYEVYPVVTYDNEEVIHYATFNFYAWLETIYLDSLDDYYDMISGELIDGNAEVLWDNNVLTIETNPDYRIVTFVNDSETPAISAQITSQSVEYNNEITFNNGNTTVILPTDNYYIQYNYEEYGQDERSTELNLWLEPDDGYNVTVYIPNYWNWG